MSNEQNAGFLKGLFFSIFFLGLIFGFFYLFFSFYLAISALVFCFLAGFYMTLKFLKRFSSSTLLSLAPFDGLKKELVFMKACSGVYLYQFEGDRLSYFVQTFLFNSQIRIHLSQSLFERCSRDPLFWEAFFRKELFLVARAKKRRPIQLFMFYVCLSPFYFSLSVSSYLCSLLLKDKSHNDVLRTLSIFLEPLLQWLQESVFVRPGVTEAFSSEYLNLKQNISVDFSLASPESVFQKL